MDPDLPPGMGGFFQGLLGDLLRLMRTDSPVQWDLAIQLASSVASDNTSEPNVEPVERIRLEELARIAELHVAEVTGIALTASGRSVAVVPVGRAEWARRSLADWRPLIEQVAASMAPMPTGQAGSDAPGASGGQSGPEARRSGEHAVSGQAPDEPASEEASSGKPASGKPTSQGSEPGSTEGAGDGTETGGLAGFEGLGELRGLGDFGGLADLARMADLGNLAGGGAPGASDEAGSPTDLAALIGQWTTAIAPAMVAMQVGSVVGHLATRALGQYELPLPRRAEDEILVVPANLAAFAADWSLPIDDVRMWLLVRDLVSHALLNRPAVRARVEALLVEHARTIHPDPKALDARLSEVAGDLADLTRLLGDPTAFGESLDTPEARRVRAMLAAVESAIAGYVEWATEIVAGRLIGARAPVSEAMRRRRVERGNEERSAESLFGLRLDQERVDKGLAFVRGVVQRAGAGALDKLWLLTSGLPTPAEVDAPGLWLERVNLPPLVGPDEAPPG